MIKHITQFLFFLTVLLVAPLHATGAEAESRANFTVLSWGGNVRDIYYENSDGSEVPFRSSSRMRMGPYRYAGPSEMVFYRKNTDGEGELKIPVGRARLPGGSGNYTLVLFPGDASNGAEAFRGVAVNQSFDGLPEKSLTFVNVSPHMVAGVIGDDRFVLRPGGTSSVYYKGNSEDARSIVRLAFQKEGEVEMFWSAAYSMTAGIRNVFFIGLNPDDELTVVRLQERAN